MTKSTTDSLKTALQKLKKIAAEVRKKQLKSKEYKKKMINLITNKEN